MTLALCNTPGLRLPYKARLRNARRLNGRARGSSSQQGRGVCFAGGAAHGFGVYVRGGGSALQREPLRLDGDGGSAEEMVRCPAAGMSASPASVVWPPGRLPGKNPPVITPGFV